jgi:5-methyltetrahydropteroyltriglutamate--homocysteine methyltransferase
VRQSEDRILTTHAGSLARPDDLVRMMWDWIDGKEPDESAVKARVAEATTEVVERQIEIGIDVVSDGEMSKTGFSNYVAQRYSGFGGRANFLARDIADAPELIEQVFATEAGQHVVLPTCIGPIEDTDPDAVHRDIENFKGALGDRSPDDAFICAVTPGHVTFNFPNRYYPSHEAYLEAAAGVLSTEYKAIVDAGFNLQLDSPDLAMAGHCVTEGSDMPDLSRHIPMAIDALNSATAGIPPEKMRLHVCWGNYLGPHNHDVGLRDIIEPILETNAKFVYFEAGNPRHEHEWRVWNAVQLPDDKVLIPGVIDSHTNHVEHPELVAERIERFADIVGKERVVAGTDCGFGTFVGWACCCPSASWLKLQSLVEGARIASDRLW